MRLKQPYLEDMSFAFSVGVASVAAVTQKLKSSPSVVARRVSEWRKREREVAKARLIGFSSASTVLY